MRRHVHIADELRRWVPRWWAGEGGSAGAALDLLLTPAEAAFRGAIALRGAAYDRGIAQVRRAPLPVVSVGNLTVGGTGKTPLCAWIARHLAERGRRPGIVLRGYGTDEVRVHAEINPGIPVFPNADRLAGARSAAGAGCDCVLLDDGFQHRRLHRELDVVLVAAEEWSRRQRMLPRGPWREPARALRRAGWVVVTRKSATRAAAGEVAAAVRALADGVPTALASLQPAGLRGLETNPAAERSESLESLAGREVLAVTTLAQPAPFLAQLRALGARPDALVLPDHHDFADAEIAGIARRSAGRPLVVTRKEAVKLRGRLPAGVRVWMVEQSVVLEEGGEELSHALARAIAEDG